MRYSEPLQSQLMAMLAFSGAGFLLGGVYAVCGFFRKLCGGRKGTFLSDLLFCFASFAVLFGASLAFTNGVWRLPELGAALAGFFAFCGSLGRVLSPVTERLAAWLRTAASKLFLPFERCSRTLWRRAAARVEQRKNARSAKAAKKDGGQKNKTKKYGKKRKKSRKSSCKTPENSV